MRTMLRGKLTLLFMSFALLLALPAVAFADVISNNIDDSVEATAETVNLTAGSGVNGNVSFFVAEKENNDGKSGCNLTGSTKLVAAVNNSDASVATVSASSVEFTSCGDVKQLTITPLKAGQTTITLEQTSNTTGGTFNLAPATFVVQVAPAAETQKDTSLAVSSASGTYGGTTNLEAKLSSSSTGVSGKSVAFTLNGNPAGSATTNSSGVATLSNVSLSGINAGTHAGAVVANFAGDTGYKASLGSNDLTVNKAAGSVSINNIPSNAVFGGSFTPDYTKSGDGTASTTSNTTGVCSVSNTGVVNFDAAGTCKLQASVTAGTNHLAATGSEQTFEIAKAPAALSFASGTLSKTYTGSAQGVQVNTDPAGLNTVTVNYFNKLADGSKGSQLSGAPTNAGSYIVEASLTNNNYQATAISGTLVIAKANADINVQGFSGTYDGTAKGASGSATGVDGSNLSGLLDLGAKFTNVPGGTANWSFAGDANHESASGSVAISIAKAATTTTVDCAAGPFTYNGSAQEPCSASVKGAGGLDQSLPVSYQNNVNAGTATASASYAASANHLGSSDSKNFQIDKATAQVTLGNLGPHVYDGTAKAATVSTVPTGLNANVTYSGSTTAPTAVGSYSVMATVNDANYKGSATGTLVINPWTLKGFYNPVDMGGIVNTVKGGATVPMKFEVFQGATELKDVSAIKSTQVFNSTACGGAQTDEIELTLTGNTSLRFDATSDQFIYNWKTPTGAGCYKVVTTTQDGSTLTAFFKTR